MSRRRFFALLLFVFFAMLPATVEAETIVRNWMELSISPVVQGPRFFDYQAGTQITWDTAAHWDSGVFDDTEKDSTGDAVQLPPPPPPFELCINSGGPDYTAVDGTLYTADQLFTGGGTITWAAPIANTQDDPMFQRIRYAFTAGGVPSYTYDIPVPAAGDYEVEIGMLESFNTPNFQNQTDLTIEGTQVLDGFDPYTVTGGLRIAIVQTFPVTVTDGTLTMLVEHDGWYGALANFCVRSVGAGSATTGTWTSAANDTTAGGTNVFGVVGADVTTPAGTDVTFQLGFGPTAAAAEAGPFIGPDGTAGSVYQAGDPIAYVHDGTSPFVALRATLTTTTAGVTPTLNRAWLTWDLAEFTTNPAVMSVVSQPAGQTGYLVRVHPGASAGTGTTAQVQGRVIAGSPPGQLEIGTDHPTTQIQFSGGVFVQTVGPAFAATVTDRHSLSLAEEQMAGSQLEMIWQSQTGGGVLLSHDFTLNLN